jgi:hypothetical protein
MAAFGFLCTALEVRYLHLPAIQSTRVAWIPTVASVVGLFGAALGLARSRMIGKVAMALLAAVAVAGLAGVYFHTELKPSRFTKLFQRGDSDPAAADSQSQAPADDDDNGAPPLAPLALTGLALIGVVAVWAKQE